MVNQHLPMVRSALFWIYSKNPKFVRVALTVVAHWIMAARQVLLFLYADFSIQPDPIEAVKEI